ncbi:porphobilinogen deaminase [Polyrhizophydium stewartii]|uniref:hydroxymethylbilane synthase n=1 Tax=Polyrhizophydium stewartii TaxID=2732419 RepID=A0ABR4ND98_9FUNG
MSPAKTTFVIGTRESQLAMVQATAVQAALAARYPLLTFDIKGMSTTGDRVLDVALSKIGSKSLFTKELEVALAEHTVDLVVHCLKDLPTQLPDGMVIGAVLEREDPHDAVIMGPSRRGAALADLPPGSVIGTSSVRRAAQLKRRFPRLVFEDVRGNLNTRLRKLDDPESKYDALILAYAGVHRLGWTDRISEVISSDIVLYAVGQGALAIECRADDADTLDILRPLSHPETLVMCTAERSFMRALEGGCSVPLGVSTRISSAAGADTLHLVGCVTRLDGSEQIREGASMPLAGFDASDAEASLERRVASADSLGKSLARVLLDKGARSILDEIRKPATA